MKGKISIARDQNLGLKFITLIAAFLLLCVGVVLLARGEASATVRHDRESAADAAQARAATVDRALESVVAADFAMTTQNYGEARAHIAHARAQLQAMRTATQP